MNVRVASMMGFGLSMSLLLSACGSDSARPSSSFRPKATKDAGPGAQDPGVELGDDTSTAPDVNAQSACATSTAKAEGAPVDLVFMVDRSGSMNDTGKWTSAVSALKAFFADPSGAGLSASLHFFGSDQGQCNVATYATPAVAMRALPEGARFSTALDRTTPNGGTPTLPALQGAFRYATQLQTQKPDSKIVVVLVTDGEPQGCDSTVGTVSAAAASAATTVPTYVIGVGDDLISLNAVAQSGGTKQAVIVSTLNPTQVTADFGKAIADIRQRALSCDYKLPLAPNGEKLDLAKVNVQLTPAGGTAATLSYNKDCAGGVGWRYDNAGAPTKIEICPASCDSAKSDAKAKMEILFGCATKGGEIK